MATILLTWELGGGLGHATILTPLAGGLLRRGHRVWVALKDLTGAREIFKQADLRFLQAPIQPPQARGSKAKPHTFAHILYDVGFAQTGRLSVRVEAWQNLFHLVRPDLIVFNHSPTALLAARGFPTRKAVVGTGFCCPPDLYPLPDLRTWEPADPKRLRADEDRLLEKINASLAPRNQQPLERVGQLYGEVDACLLTTVPELDHYPPHAGRSYYGAINSSEGKLPEWPAGSGKKIFAYLKPFKTLRELLIRLNQLGHPTILFGPQLGKRFQAEFHSATLRFENQPVDLKRVGRQADLAILNGTHGTTFSMLLSGVPMLQLPLYMEQAITARNVANLGAGLAAALNRPREITESLQTLLDSSDYARNAREIAARYADFDSQAAVEAALARLEELLG